LDTMTGCGLYNPAEVSGNPALPTGGAYTGLGFPIETGQTIRLHSQYQNPGAPRSDVMGIMIAYVASAAAPPFPKFYQNGAKLGIAHEPFLLYGAITQENATLGKITCQTVIAGKVWNETTEGTEKGLASIPGFSTENCKAETPCRVKNTRGEEVEGIYLTAE